MLGDVHGNAVALAAVLDELRHDGVDLIVWTGDLSAYWAMLGPDVDMRRTEYDVGEAVSRLRASGLPEPDQLVEVLTEPPTPAQMIEHAERLEFSG